MIVFCDVLKCVHTLEKFIFFNYIIKNMEVPAIRYCPECEEFGLEVSEDVNVYECKICGSVWQRLRPINDGKGNMLDMPKKLKKLLEN